MMIPAFIAASALKKSRSAEPVHMYATHLTTVTSKKKKKPQSKAVIHAKGGGSAPQMPSPMAEARAQAELERVRDQLLRKREAEERHRQELERKKLIQESRGKRLLAREYADSYDERELKNRGIDDALAQKYGIQSMYDNARRQAVLSLDDAEQNPMEYMTTKTWLDDAINNAQGRYRNDLKSQVNRVAGDGFEYEHFADDSDDEILMKILTGQKTDAQTQIDAARARGQLNDVGYSSAMKKLAEAESAGMADLQTLGQGVLSGYRKDLIGLRDNQLDKIGNLTFSDSYEPGAFTKQLLSRRGDMRNRLEGDIYKAAQGKSFFDPSALISGGGALQGYYNPTTGQQQSSTTRAGADGNPLLDAFTADASKKVSSTGNAVLNNGVF